MNLTKKDVIQTTTTNSPAGVFNGNSVMTDDQDIRVRKYGEVVYNTLTSVASVLEYPKGNFNTFTSVCSLVLMNLFCRFDKRFGATLVLGVRQGLRS